MPAAALNVDAETPEPSQGEMEERPSPLPKARSARVNAAAETAPAAMLAQETAESASELKLSVRSVVSIGSSQSGLCFAQGKFHPAKKFAPRRRQSALAVSRPILRLVRSESVQLQRPNRRPSIRCCAA